MKYFRLLTNNTDRLVFVNKTADKHFWDRRWNDNADWVKSIKNSKNINSPLIRRMRKYLPNKAVILEGGCGRGEILYLLHNLEYNITGVDYAPETVAKLNKCFPQLKVQLGDVFNLKDFQDDSFDGYYIGGVIEHFWNGYNQISNEMYRVLKDGGYLFITFPYMSMSRRRLVKKLDIIDHNVCPEGFYQYALPIHEVVTHFSKLGFSFESKLLRNGLRGLLDLYPNSHFVRNLYHKKSKSKLGKISRYLISTIAAYLGYGHTCLLVFKKSKSKF